MKTFNDLYDMCDSIIDNGVIDASPDDVMEIIEAAHTMFDNILWFLNEHKNTMMDAVYDKSACSEVMCNIFDQLSYYLED